MSTHPDRIAESTQLFDFTLADKAIAQLDRTNVALENKWWRAGEVETVPGPGSTPTPAARNRA